MPCLIPLPDPAAPREDIPAAWRDEYHGSLHAGAGAVQAAAKLVLGWMAPDVGDLPVRWFFCPAVLKQTARAWEVLDGLLRQDCRLDRYSELTAEQRATLSALAERAARRAHILDLYASPTRAGR